MRDFTLKRGGSGRITMAALQQGRFCGACHDGKSEVGGAVVFSLDECDRCHR
jgi:c(7)-type cytochrome triheme protein